MLKSKTSDKGVGAIINLYGREYRRTHKLPAAHHKAMFAIQHCRTAVLGGRVNTCSDCHHSQIVYNSCRNRHCPQCQGLNSIKWVDKLSAGLLPVKYFHMVFTIPSELNRLALVNQKCVYDILFKAASQSILQLAADTKYLHAQAGMVAILHTWGQNLMDHPHLHIMLPAGGWSEVAQCWMPSRKKFFLPVKVISSVFRGKFLSFLKGAYSENQLKFEGEIKSLQNKGGFQSLINRLYEKPWVVYCKPPFKNSSQIIKYLGRYSHRVAIDNSRILSVDQGQVEFTWKDYKDNGRRKTMKLKSDEFIRRFLMHVLPKGFCKIRYYGIFASRNRSSLLQKCMKTITHAVNKALYAGLPWHEIILMISGKNVLSCPICKSGEIVSAFIFKGGRASPE